MHQRRTANYSQVVAHLAPEDTQPLPLIQITERGVMIGRGGDDMRKKTAEAGLVCVYLGLNEVSKSHCRIFKTDGRWYLQQDSETNGVYLRDNGRPIRS
jgi:hypothetical protein